MTDADNRTHAEKLASDIGDAIFSGDFPPGFHLDEQKLAARYKVSRTPVREALRQLAASGLIEIRPRRGAIVTRITSEQLDALFVAMGEMEATCARLSALSMTPIERRRLQSLHERMGDMAAKGDREAYADANQAFHGLIYQGAHNSVLADVAVSLRRRLGPFRRAQFRAEGRLPLSFAEHDTVVKAIVSGDAASAHATMLHHVSLVEDTFEQLAAAEGDAPPSNLLLR